MLLSFLGEGSQTTRLQVCGRESDSGLSDSNSDSKSEEEIKAKSCAAHLAGIAFDEKNSRFKSLLPENMVEVQHLPQETEITMGDDIQ